VNVFGEIIGVMRLVTARRGFRTPESARASAFRAVAFPQQTRRNLAKLLLTR
jgi:hypothetical protein